MLKCPDLDCEHSQSEDDNNFRGSALPNGGETFSCKVCGTEAFREVIEPDAILLTAPLRPLKSGDATNFPSVQDFDISEEKEEKDHG